MTERKKPGPPKGTPKTPGSGRKKGTPNRRTRDAIEYMERTGFNPLEVLRTIATNRKNQPEVRTRAAAEFAKYVFPQRKAVEMTGKDAAPIEVNINTGMGG